MQYRRELFDGRVLISEPVQLRRGLSWRVWIEGKKRSTIRRGASLTSVSWTVVGFDPDNVPPPEWLERWSEAIRRGEEIGP
jgi:hypothetical protein